MPLPRLNLPSVRGALRRPAVLAPVTTVALAALLGAGLLVAGAVEPGPTTTVDATASPSAGSAGGGTTSGGDDNAAVAVNTKDGSTVYAVRLKVVITGADTVDSGNAAVAAASCSDCQTVAIALEGVIVTGDAEVIAPVNIALAINSGCSGCQTLAYAYQNLQTVDGKVRLTGAGREGIARLRQQLNTLRTSGLDLPAVKAEVDRIAAEFAAILRSEVVPIGRPAGAATPRPDAVPTPGRDGRPAGSLASSDPQPASQAPAPASPSPSPASTEPAGSAEPAASAEPTPTG